MTDLLARFDDRFSPLLGGSQRWQAFRLIASMLLGRGKPLTIIETGTIRTLGNWHGDGQSTLVWDELCRITNGRAWSVDIDFGACSLAKSQVERVTVACEDSIRFLAGLPDVAAADLLYLDSFDWTHGRFESCLHHAGELAVAWERLPSGCIVAVDDCFSPEAGKHLLVDRFFQLKGIDPLLRSYVHVWRKP